MSNRRTALIGLLVALTTAAACSGPRIAETTRADGSPAAPQSPATGEVPAARATTGAAPAVPPRTATGTVREKIDAAPYTYVRLDTASGEVWAASGQFDVKVGDRVVVPLDMPMENFHSKSLDRDFPLLYFASRIVPEGAPPDVQSPHVPGPMASHPPAPAASSQVSEVVPQPAGATSVASLWARRRELAGQVVTVRGKVVKFNGGILDRNWVHLQDGTGKADDRTNDLAVTMAEVVRVGDVVTLRGTLAVDRDFGAGYAYPVILEKATLVK